MGVRERLLEFINSENLSISEFERRTGLSNGYVNKDRRRLSKDKIRYINKAFPNLNTNWVDTGEGEMLLGNAQDEQISANTEIVMIPVINLDARGGFAANDELGVEYATDNMPFSKRIARAGDIVIPVYGDSMAPKFPSGCMVLIRKVEMWREYIELGATYVMELVDGRRLIKNIKKSDNSDCFLLESINPEYQPTDIPKKMINLIFRVIMSIQRESL